MVKPWLNEDVTNKYRSFEQQKIGLSQGVFRDVYPTFIVANDS
jgi:hypothetical protein